ncbi:MAG: radical SAM protein [Bacteroidales bacterium]|jgi:uncharacterized protein|nr:radical SAM protein [Bacteroidales bacterium]
MSYKLNKYIYIKEKNNTIVIYNLLNRIIFALTRDNYYALINQDLENLQKNKPTLFNAMYKLGIIVPDFFNELDYVKTMNRKVIFDRKQYRLTINPTLECNFHCWYCYENHPKGHMNKNTIQSIINHITLNIQERNLQSLLIDWFGGEPLIYFDEVIYPLTIELQKLLNKHQINLLNSITTNGYLINEKRAKLFEILGITNFQITLDGNQTTHDKIRFLKNREGTFQTIIDNINLLSEYRKNTIMVRINYTQETLKDINEIVNCFSQKAKSKICIAFQQVWQDSFHKYVSAEDNKEYFKANGFNVDFFELNTKFHVCYADKINQAVINYDGRVFKCTARNFTTHPHDGILLSDGKIDWNILTYSKRFGNATFENEYCINCSLLPVCMGPCSQKMMEFNRNDDFQSFCLKMGIEEVIEQHIEQHYQSINQIDK